MLICTDSLFQILACNNYMPMPMPMVTNDGDAHQRTGATWAAIKCYTGKGFEMGVDKMIQFTPHSQEIELEKPLNLQILNRLIM